MTEKLKQIIKEEIIKLPKELQDAIASLDWGSITEEIGKKYLLTESEINDLQTETLLILVGLEYGDSYALNIENNVGVSQEQAEKIAEEINQKIFIPISDKLVENIKKVGKDKNPNWQQTLDFIMSGGDYSAFIANREHNTSSALNSPLPEHPFGGGGQKVSTSFEPEGSQSLNGPAEATPPEGNKKDAGILKSAGIEIIEQAPITSTTFPAKIAPPATPLPTPLVTPLISGSILEQKMSKPFQIPMVKTEHFLENISKSQPSTNSPFPEHPLGRGENIPPSPLQGEGQGVRYVPPQPSATPQEGNKTKVPISPQKNTDLKSKFTI